MTANKHIRKGRNSYEKVKTIKYLGSLLPNHYSIQEEIKCRLKLLIFMLLFSLNAVVVSTSKNLKIKIYRTIILPVVLYGWETWSLTLREECWLRIFEKRILRREYLGLRGMWMESVEGSTMRNTFGKA